MVPYRPEPLSDFSNPAVAAEFERALACVSAQLGKRYPMIIGGRRVDAPESITSVNPSRPDQVVGYAARGGLAEAEVAVDAALEAFPAWSRTPAEVRARILFKAAAVMRRRKHELSAWLSHEVGKNWVEADADTAEAIDFLEYYGRQMLKLAAPQELTRIPGEENHLYYRPLGVGVVHSPFNFPLAILTGMTAAAIVTGNTVVVKPSTEAPVIAAKLFEVLEEAGLPPGVANLLYADPVEVGDYLTIHREVRFINFTGSRHVGCQIYEKAAKVQPGQIFLRRVIAEMGGKDAIIVDGTADLDEAAAGIVTSAFGFSGQKCSACSRAIVTADVYDQLLGRVVARTRALKVGPATDRETDVGPVAAARFQQKILEYIEIGKSEGRLVTGGNALPGGYYVEPTIFADVAPTARIAQEEIFGPVLAFIKADDFAHALRIANGTEYGLTGAVYTRSRENLELARQEFMVGNLYFNRKCTGAIVGAQPFGGFNMSGTDSKAGGPDYLLLFTQAQTVVERL
ncbi:L-glutamate gamma-semialdehyde dehydrogenase [Symbiobacterium terraclitae]|uniref:L-glutamate gamma-semialdehyde dehydrogenase n=1 Tax=Symbiobacterium terraclitae TaxID=557451 RepID=UPI0035B51EB7